MKYFLSILAALLFSSFQSVNGQGFEFSHAEKSDGENRVLRLFYDDDTEKVIVQLDYGENNRELISFDHGGNKINGIPLETSFDGYFPVFAEYK